jgi:hypothetical protein
MPRPPESLPADQRHARECRISRRMAGLCLAIAALAFPALFRVSPLPGPEAPFRPPAPLALAGEADFDAASPAADPRDLLSPAVYALPTRIGFTHRLVTAVPSADSAADPGAGDVPRLPAAPGGDPAAAPAVRREALFRSPLPVPAPAEPALPPPESIALPAFWRDKISFPEKFLALLAEPASAKEARSLPAADVHLVFDAEGRLLSPLLLSPAPSAVALPTLLAALGGTELLDGTAPRSGDVRFRLPPAPSAP